MSKFRQLENVLIKNELTENNQDVAESIHRCTLLIHCICDPIVSTSHQSLLGNFLMMRVFHRSMHVISPSMVKIIIDNGAHTIKAGVQKKPPRCVFMVLIPSSVDHNAVF